MTRIIGVSRASKAHADSRARSRAIRLALLLAIALPSVVLLMHGRADARPLYATDISDVPPAKQAELVEHYKRNTENDLKFVQSLEADAIKKKDLVEQSCVNEKKIELQKLVELMNSSKIAFDQAVKDGNQAARQAEFIKMATAYERALELRKEAASCAGQVLTYSGDTIVEITVGDIPDPTDPGFGDISVDHPTDFTPISEPSSGGAPVPPKASPSPTCTCPTPTPAPPPATKSSAVAFIYLIIAFLVGLAIGWLISRWRKSRGGGAEPPVDPLAFGATGGGESFPAGGSPAVGE